MIKQKMKDRDVNMTNQEKILDIAKANGGFITTKEIVKNNINKVFYQG